MLSDNNLALNYYSDSDYSTANLLRVILQVLSYIAIVFLFVGCFHYKLIPLELSAVFQVAGFATLALEDLSPMMSALDGLSPICFGYRAKLFPENVTLSRQFQPMRLYFNFLNNYNVMSLLVLVPLLLSGLVSLAGCICANSESKKSFNKAAKVILTEYAFFGMMLSAYPLLISTVIGVKGWTAASSLEKVALAPAGFFVVLLIAFLVAEIVYKGLFGSFDEFFKQSSSISNYFYAFIII